MTEIVLKRFLIEGNGEIQDVGARPKIYELGNKNGVQVFPRNLRGNKIEVIVKGDKDSIKMFWDCIKNADLRQVKNPSTIQYKISGLQDYEGDPPDFGYFAGSSTMEQVSKGTRFLSSIDTRLKKLDRLDTLPRDMARELAKELRKQK